MKKLFLAFVLLLLTISIFACAPKEQAPADTAADTQPEKQDTQPESTKASDKLGLDKIFNYGALKSYEYKITSNYDGQKTVSNIKYTITSDSVNGKSAWLMTSSMSSQGANVVTKIWTDKVTYKCLKISSVVEAAGQKFEQPGQCPDEDIVPASASSDKTPEVNYVGKESVTVPAGTFSASKYAAEGVTYWVGDKVPLPLKYTYADGQVVMELVSYS